MTHKKNIVIFASGNGSNAENIILHFKKSKIATVSLVLSNNKNAFVIKRAKKLGVQTIIFNKKSFYENNKVADMLTSYKTDIVVLAGFLWLVSNNIIKRFNKIINLHPSLLPKFGGKGMYGKNVHQAVKKTKQEETGITIHRVNEAYDEGHILFQTNIKLMSIDNIDDIALKVKTLEHKYYPMVIESLLHL